MLLAILLATAAVANQSEADFARSYRIRISVEQRACTYWLDGMGLDLRQLRAALKRGYDVTRGAEILVDAATPARCARMARHIARQSGFARIRSIVAERLPDPHQ